MLYNAVTRKGLSTLEQIESTHENILRAGKREFLENGFRGASLRRIVKEAAVTTGAFYGYYKNKEALFDALVAKPYETLLEKFLQAQDAFAQLPMEEQPGQMGAISGQCMEWMVEYIYDHFDVFYLLVCCAEGTRYEHFIHQLVEVEVKATHQFMDVLKKMGHPIREMDAALEHILVSGLFSAFFEIVAHRMPKEQAVVYVQELRSFYTAGWERMLGL